MNAPIANPRRGFTASIKPEHFGRACKLEREGQTAFGRKISRREVAEAIQIPYNTYKALEYGKGKLDLDILDRLRQFYCHDEVADRRLIEAFRQDFGSLAVKPALAVLAERGDKTVEEILREKGFEVLGAFGRAQCPAVRRHCSRLLELCQRMRAGEVTHYIAIISAQAASETLDHGFALRIMSKAKASLGDSERPLLRSRLAMVTQSIAARAYQLHPLINLQAFGAIIRDLETFKSSAFEWWETSAYAHLLWFSAHLDASEDITEDRLTAAYDQFMKAIVWSGAEWGYASAVLMGVRYRLTTEGRPKSYRWALDRLDSVQEEARQFYFGTTYAHVRAKTLAAIGEVDRAVMELETWLEDPANKHLLYSRGQIQSLLYQLHPQCYTNVAE